MFAEVLAMITQICHEQKKSIFVSHDIEAKSWLQKNLFFTCPDQPVPTFSRAHPKILKHSRFIFFQSRVIRDTSWPP